MLVSSFIPYSDITKKGRKALVYIRLTSECQIPTNRVEYGPIVEVVCPIRLYSLRFKATSASKPSFVF